MGGVRWKVTGEGPRSRGSVAKGRSVADLCHNLYFPNGGHTVLGTLGLILLKWRAEFARRSTSGFRLSGSISAERAQVSFQRQSRRDLLAASMGRALKALHLRLSQPCAFEPGALRARLQSDTRAEHRRDETAAGGGEGVIRALARAVAVHRARERAPTWRQDEFWSSSRNLCPN